MGMRCFVHEARLKLGNGDRGRFGAGGCCLVPEAGLEPAQLQ